MATKGKNIAEIIANFLFLNKKNWIKKAIKIGIKAKIDKKFWKTIKFKIKIKFKKKNIIFKTKGIFIWFIIK